MKNFTRPWWLSPGIGLFTTALIFFFIMPFTGYRLPYTPDRYTAELHIRFQTDDPVQEGAIQKSLSAIRARLNATHAGYDICSVNDHAYRLSIKGIIDTAGIGSLITTNNRLGFYAVYTLPEIAMALGWIMEKKPSVFTPARAFIQNGANIFPAYTGYVNNADTALLQAMFRDSSLQSLLPAGTRLAFHREEGNTMEVYALRRFSGVLLDNESILHASSHINDHNGEPQVIITFTPAAAADWHRFTAANAGRPVAICLNNHVLSAPVVQEPIHNSRAVITGGMSEEEAQWLGMLIQSPQLPLPVWIEQQHFSRETSLSYIPCLVIFLLITMISFSISFALSQRNQKKTCMRSLFPDNRF